MISQIVRDRAVLRAVVGLTIVAQSRGAKAGSDFRHLDGRPERPMATAPASIMSLS